MSRIDNALGFISDEYVNEALDYRKASVKTVSRRRFLPIAAVICAFMLAVGAAAFGLWYFAPGFGIVAQGQVRVLAANEQYMLGDIILDTVMLSDDGGVGTLSVWVYRTSEVEVTPDEQKQGIIPVELLDFRAVIDGREYNSGTGRLGTSGYSRYTFYELPIGEAFDSIELRTGDDSVSVRLAEIKGSEASLIRYDGGQLTLLPVSPSGNIWAGELFDEFLLELSENDPYGATVTAMLATRLENGEIGRMAGNVYLNGGQIKREDAIRVGGDYMGIPIERASLQTLTAMFHYDGVDVPYTVTATVPEVGEAVKLDEVLLEVDGFRIILTEVRYHEDNGLLYGYRIENETAHEDIQYEFVDIAFKSRGRVTLASGEVKNDVLRPVYMADIDGEKRLCRGDISGETIDIPLNPGDEIVVMLRGIMLTFSPDGEAYEPDSFEPNMGECRIK